MMICIQCALEAFVSADGLSDAADPWQAGGRFNEEPAEHYARVHPNGVDGDARRKLEEKALEIIRRRGLDLPR